MENTFRPSRFLSLRATTPSPCTWEEIVQELTGERHTAATALFRALAACEGQDAETAKRQQGQIKQNQPAFIPSVLLEGGRSSKHIKGYPFNGAIRAINEAADLVGFEKLMWGSDYPRTITAITYKMSYDFVIKSKELEERSKKLFLGENAKAFYGFKNLPELPYIKNMSE